MRRLAGHQLPAERLRPCDHLIERAQDDRVADILHDHLTALGKAVLLAQFRRQTQPAVRHDLGFHGASPSRPNTTAVAPVPGTYTKIAGLRHAGRIRCCTQMKASDRPRCSHPIAATASPSLVSRIMLIGCVSTDKLDGGREPGPSLEFRARARVRRPVRLASANPHSHLGRTSSPNCKDGS